MLRSMRAELLWSLLSLLHNRWHHVTKANMKTTLNLYEKDMRGSCVSYWVRFWRLNETPNVSWSWLSCKLASVKLSEAPCSVYIVRVCWEESRQREGQRKERKRRENRKWNKGHPHLPHLLLLTLLPFSPFTCIDTCFISMRSWRLKSDRNKLNFFMYSAPREEKRIKQVKYYFSYKNRKLLAQSQHRYHHQLHP